MSLYSDTYQFPDGKTGSGYLRLTRDDYVVIFAINKNNAVIINKQYRRGVDKINIELPAGVLHKCEKPEDAAVRELREEVGYECTVKNCFEIFPQPAFINFKAYITICELGEKCNKEIGDDDEFIESEIIQLEKVEEMVLRGEVQDNSLITALGLYKLFSKNDD
jgi:ADP-ribose pyrophosphatase